MESAPKTGLKWYSSPRKLLRAILMLDDSRHSIALGTAIGVAFGMTPTVGIQMLLVFAFSLLTRPFFRFNVIAAMIAVYISNPLTMVPLYYFDYLVGSLFLEGEAPFSRFTEILSNEENLNWWTQIYTLLVEFGWPLVLGSLILGTFAGLATYPFMMWLLKSFRHGRRTAPEATIPATQIEQSERHDAPESKSRDALLEEESSPPPTMVTSDSAL
ncbi:MAG: hypothetical protein CMJ46_16405 [Planctomyces sp.]|nr:hypothetical protein [Planctomyces sp.]